MTREAAFSGIRLSPRDRTNTQRIIKHEPWKYLNDQDDKACSEND